MGFRTEDGTIRLLATERPMNNPRTIAAFVHDLAVVYATWLFAFWLRFNFEMPPPEFYESAFDSLFWLLPLYGALFLVFGLYRGMWRFASLADLQHLAGAAVLGAVLTMLVVAFFTVRYIPRSVLVIHPLLVAIFMGGSRFAYRSWKEHRLYGPRRVRGQPVIVIGAGLLGVFGVIGLALLFRRRRAWHRTDLPVAAQHRAGREQRGVAPGGGDPR